MRTFTRSLFLLLCWGSTSWLLAQPGTATGTRFHLAYMANYAGNPVQALNVFVSSHQDAVGTLSIPGYGFSQGFNVVAGTTTTLTLPPGFTCTVSEFAESKGVLVETDVPVSVQALNFEQYTADGTNVWPEEMLGRDYFVMAYKGLDGQAGLSSEFLIVSTVDSIDVTITPSVVTATGRPAGVPFTVTLGAHQTYLVSALLEADDLTGSRIAAEVPQGTCDGIAVFGGSRCPNVPTGCYACDHLYEQLPPLSAWGTSYFSVPFTGPSSYTLRALASEDNTTLTYNGTPYSLDMGEVVEWNSVTTAVYIEADKPVSVAQYMEGTVCAQQGDPSMLMLSAEDQGVDQAIFSTVVSTVITSHRMGLVTDAINAGAVLLDGVAIPAASFTPYIQRPDKAYADVLLTQGSHSLIAPGPFLAHNYGFGAAESYAQGIGSALPPALGQDSIICHPGGPITLDAPAGLGLPYWYDAADPSDTLALGVQYTFTPGGMW
ncbi:MAG: IgGFc-binding protein [Flavobacteriales bacterium]|nr:IgGFc-binding protein [Flavobacteriales bacterium]